MLDVFDVDDVDVAVVDVAVDVDADV